MQTSTYRTRTEWTPKIYEKVKTDENLWVIGLDSGYGGMKGFSPNKYFCFPSYAKLLNQDKSMMAMFDKNDVIYQDLDTGELYLLGRNAQNSISKNDTNDTDGELFTRKRYKNKKFYVLCMAAIALACMPNYKDPDTSGIGKEIILQAGLPPAYLDMDKEPYTQMLTRPANFRLKVGKNPWQELHIAIKPENVHVMAQPSGTMASINIGNNGQYIQDARKYLTGNVLIIDIGFNTMDVYGMKGHILSANESFDTFGMRAILQMVSEEIKKEKNEEIRVAAMQKYLEKGTIPITKEMGMDEEDFTFSDEEWPFDKILEKCSYKVCNMALKHLSNITDQFADYEYLVVTGGTGAAWYDWIQDKFKNSKLQIIPGNRNDNLDMLYANVRGYYLFRSMNVINQMRKRNN